MAAKNIVSIGIKILKKMLLWSKSGIFKISSINSF